MIRPTHTHWAAVATIASIAIFHGGSFGAIRKVLCSGLSAGPSSSSLRFALATIMMGVLLLVRREPLALRALLDDAFLGILLATLFWLQSDGLRFTTTSKSGFSTSLYVPFTPLLAIVLHDRVRAVHVIAALLATFWAVHAGARTRWAG